MGKISGIAVVIILVLAVVGWNSAAYTVDQTEQAIVLRFGKVEKTVREPGLYFKIPFADEIVFYEKRILDLDPAPVKQLLTDQKTIEVDAYARYRITDPLIFFQRVQNYRTLNDRFSKVVRAAVQRVIANASLGELLSEKRIDIMAQIRTEVERQGSTFGIDIVDVRIGRTDLPAEISQNVYSRMSTDQERKARETRALGQEQAKIIRAKADRERTVLIAEAERKAEILRGEGEAQRVTILADAYGRDPDFFDFYKSMQEYRKSLGGEGTTMVLTPEGDFFRFFGQELKQ
ncbi:MAG: protease modulator HflC [Alphaproteobacteria bacterium]|nr:protease modulator HflC [Alphaproteobacteria bacterium]